MDTLFAVTFVVLIHLSTFIIYALSNWSFKLISSVFFNQTWYSCTLAPYLLFQVICFVCPSKKPVMTCVVTCTCLQLTSNKTNDLLRATTRQGVVLCVNRNNLDYDFQLIVLSSRELVLHSYVRAL